MDGHFDIFFDILLKPPQPFTGLFLTILHILGSKCVLLLLVNLSMKWFEWGNMPYLPRSHRGYPSASLKKTM